MKNRELSLQLLVLACALTLIACGDEPKDGDETPPPTTSTVEPVEGGTMTIALAGDPDTLNPLTRRTLDAGTILGAVNRGLATLTKELVFEPAVASHWTWSDDGLTLTFYLRRDVKWSDGEPFTARDVVVSYELTLDERVASPRRSEFNNVTSLELIDEFTVAFHFAQRAAQQLFNAHSLSLVPAHVVGDLDPANVASWSINREPITLGAYRLASWESGGRIVLERNPHYYGDRAHIDELVFEIVPEESVRMLKLENGEIDMLADIPPREVARLRDDPNSPIRLYTLAGRRYGYLAYNTESALFADSRVRQAISYAIDRQAMIDGLMFGLGDRLASSIPPFLGPAHHSGLQPHRRDKTRALELLAEAGWTDTDDDGLLDRDGEPFRFELKTKLGDSVRENGALIIQRNLKEIGIEVRPTIQELPTTLEQVRSGDFDVYYGQFGTRMAVDPTSQFSTGGRYNHARYSNPRIDELIPQGLLEMDEARANQIWHEVQEILHEDQPWSYLYLIYPVVGIHQRFQDCTPHAISAYEEIERWWRLPDQP